MPKWKRKHPNNSDVLLSFSPKPLSQSDLPTGRDVMSYVSFLQESGRVPGHTLLLEVAREIIAIYQQKDPNISLLFDTSVVQKIKHARDKLLYFRRSGGSYYKRLKFNQFLEKLFEILRCQCPMSKVDESGAVKITVDCSCPPKDKLPAEMLELLFEVRERGNKAAQELESIAEIESNERRQQKRYLNNVKRIKQEVIESSELQQFCEGLSDPCPQPRSSALVSFPKREQEPVPMPTIAREAMRWGTSDREVAAIVAATLLDFGLANPDDPFALVDEQAIRREKENLRKEVQEVERKNPNEQAVKGIYFEILTVLLQNGGDAPNRTLQERVVVSSQPDGQRLACITPTGNTEKVSTDTVMLYLGQSNLIRDVKVIGADSSILKTSNDGGDDLLTRIERSREERVHRSICSLYTLELCLKNLFEEVVGENSLIGKSLPRVDELYWNVTFPPIVAGPRLPPLATDAFRRLSYDLRYLYLAVASIRCGEIQNSLTELKTRLMNHERWLTRACRICRLYLSQHSLQGRNLKKLNDLTYYIVTNYSVLWMEIVLRPHISDASNHLLRQVQLLRFLPSSTRNLVTPFVQSWNAHPENLLVALLCHDDPVLREIGVQKMMRIRCGSDQGDSSVRPYFPPRLNLSANSIADLIDWETTALYESVLTSHLTIVEIHNLLAEKLVLPPFPSHTISLERMDGGVATLVILPKPGVDEKCSSMAVI